MYTCTTIARETQKSANALDVHAQICSYSNDSGHNLNETDQVMIAYCYLIISQ